MTTEEIIQAVIPMKSREKIRLVNEILASMKGEKPTPQQDDNTPTMPVYEALAIFNDLFRAKKGVSYAPNNRFQPRDFKAMKDLLWKIEERIVEGGTYIVDDALRLRNLRGFVEAVCQMKNQWYYENRFTPYGLNADFEKIYMNLVNNDEHARRKTAFNYL